MLAARQVLSVIAIVPASAPITRPNEARRSSIAPIIISPV